MDSSDTGGLISYFYRSKPIILSFKSDFSTSNFRVPTGSFSKCMLMILNVGKINIF